MDPLWKYIQPGRQCPDKTILIFCDIGTLKYFKIMKASLSHREVSLSLEVWLANGWGCGSQVLMPESLSTKKTVCAVDGFPPKLSQWVSELSFSVVEAICNFSLWVKACVLGFPQWGWGSGILHFTSIGAWQQSTWRRLVDPTGWRHGYCCRVRFVVFNDSTALMTDLLVDANNNQESKRSRVILGRMFNCSLATQSFTSTITTWWSTKYPLEKSLWFSDFEWFSDWWYFLFFHRLGIIIPND